jgi:hypothetical protein
MMNIVTPRDPNKPVSSKIDTESLLPDDELLTGGYERIDEIEEKKDDGMCTIF